MSDCSKTPVKLGDTVYYYVKSYPYVVHGGKVVAIDKTEKLVGKRTSVHVRSVTVKTGTHTWETKDFFLTKKDCALICREEARDELRYYTQQRNNRCDAITAMNEILETLEITKGDKE